MSINIGTKSNFFYDLNEGFPFTVDITINNESLRQVGFDNEFGLPKYIFLKTPSITERLTCTNVFAEGKTWLELIDEWKASLDLLAQSGATTREVIEDVSIDGLAFISAKTKKYLFNGSYVISQSTAAITGAPDEFNIVETASASIQPSGFFPNGEGFFNNKFEGITYSRTSTILLEKVKEYVVGKQIHGTGFIISKSCSSPKLIGENVYVELSISYLKDLEAEIEI